MIPITLTQVGAVENMGVLVWVAGEARAIPRNYYHVVLDDLPVWFSNFTTYNLELINAVHEAPGKHGFITQYAGSSSLVVGSARLRRGASAIWRRCARRRRRRTICTTCCSTITRFDGTLLSILAPYIPEPPKLVDHGPAAAVLSEATTATRSTSRRPIPTAARRRRSIRARSPTRSRRAS